MTWLLSTLLLALVIGIALAWSITRKAGHQQARPAEKRR